MVPEEFCLDRACMGQEGGAHYIHHKDDLNYRFVPLADPRLKKHLEEAKYYRGMRCWECTRFLIPTDDDHSFCEDCWLKLMIHEYVGDDFICEDCGEKRAHEYHAKSLPVQHGENL